MPPELFSVAQYGQTYYVKQYDGGLKMHSGV